MHCASLQGLFRLGKQRALGAEKEVKVLTGGRVLAVGEVAGDLSCMETNAW